MTIDEIKFEGEVVLYEGTSNVNNKKIECLIFILVCAISIISFFAFSQIEDVDTSYRLLTYSVLFFIAVGSLYKFITSIYLISTNNNTKYWITNERIIMLKGKDKVIENSISNLSVVNILSNNKKNLGSILFIFDTSENFIKSLRASVSNIKDTNKVILFNRVQDPIKAVKIIKNLNEDIYLSDDKKLMPEEEEDA
jgi:hypothetical protein